MLGFALFSRDSATTCSDFVCSWRARQFAKIRLSVAEWRRVAAATSDFAWLAGRLERPVSAAPESAGFLSGGSSRTWASNIVPVMTAAIPNTPKAARRPNRTESGVRDPRMRRTRSSNCRTGDAPNPSAAGTRLGVAQRRQYRRAGPRSRYALRDRRSRCRRRSVPASPSGGGLRGARAGSTSKRPVRTPE